MIIYVILVRTPNIMSCLDKHFLNKYEAIEYAENYLQNVRGKCVIQVVGLDSNEPVFTKSISK